MHNNGSFKVYLSLVRKLLHLCKFQENKKNRIKSLGRPARFGLGDPVRQRVGLGDPVRH